MRNEERNSKIPHPYFSSHLYSQGLGINFAIINCDDIINTRLDRPSGRERGRQHDNVGGGRFKMREECAREDVKEEADYVETTTKVTEAAIMKGVNHSNQTVLVTMCRARSRGTSYLGT